ncbi:MAG: mechanosensitive ion channel family protein [Bacteroidota bacterium]
MNTLLQNIRDELVSFYYTILEAAPLLIIGLIVAFLYFWISKIIRKRITIFLKSKAEDPLQVNFVSDIFKIINVLIGTVLFFYIIGKQNIISSILGAGAISAFVIGFAFKDIGENFLAGIILAFKRPFRIGDVVMIQDIEGIILDLNLRETHLKTFDGKDVYIPNGILLKNPLFNYTIDGYIRQQFSFGFDYGTDIKMARKILLETINSIPGVLQKYKLAKTSIQDAGLYKINIVTQYWIDPTDSNYSGSEIKSQAIKKSLDLLKQNGIDVTSHLINLESSSSQ